MTWLSFFFFFFSQNLFSTNIFHLYLKLFDDLQTWLCVTLDRVRLAVNHLLAPAPYSMNRYERAISPTLLTLCKNHLFQKMQRRKSLQVTVHVLAVLIALPWDHLSSKIVRRKLWGFVFHRTWIHVLMVLLHLFSHGRRRAFMTCLYKLGVSIFHLALKSSETDFVHM